MIVHALADPVAPPWTAGTYRSPLFAQLEELARAGAGALGALPMTAVIVHSSANVQAGAKTKASRVMHGVWLPLFSALPSSTPALIPLGPRNARRHHRAGPTVRGPVIRGADP